MIASPSHSILPHTLRRPAGLIETASVLDIGAGVRPFSWWTPLSHVCVEPFAPYRHVLLEAGYRVAPVTAREALEPLGVFKYGSVLLLDVIEHMEKQDGLEVLELAKRAARHQVVVYTPLGFLEQTEDAWGYGGHEWQRHRSGWTPEEFPGWAIDLGTQSFFAIWTHP